MVWTSLIDAPVSQAMNARSGRCRGCLRHADDALAGRLETALATWHIASSGFETTTTVALGECFTASFVTAATIASFVVTRSSRLIPEHAARRP